MPTDDVVFSYHDFSVCESLHESVTRVYSGFTDSIDAPALVTLVFANLLIEISACTAIDELSRGDQIVT